MAAQKAKEASELKAQADAAQKAKEASFQQAAQAQVARPSPPVCMILYNNICTHTNYVDPLYVV